MLSHQAHHPATEALEALTASTNLRTLQLGLWRHGVFGFHSVRFPKGAQYPHLRLISLYSEAASGCTPVSSKVLQQLCSCPAVERLDFAPDEQISNRTLQCLQQLSALTRLGVYEVGSTAAATVVSAVVQLTSLKHL
jgi:hypothetical protein